MVDGTSVKGHDDIVSRGVIRFLFPNGGGLPSCILRRVHTPCFRFWIGATTMRMTWPNMMRCLPVIYLMSGLVACGSLAHCLNSGFASVSCGSGGGYGESHPASIPHPTAPSAEGRWTGTTTSSRILHGLVLDDGSYWVFYAARDNPSVPAGLVQGTGTSHSGSFGSTNTRDFNFEGAGIRTATMSGTYVPATSFRGTIAYFNGDTESFTTTYDAESESAPNRNLVVGNYAGVRADNHTVTVTVESAGTLSGQSSDGCTFAGTLSPRAKGNVFHHAVTFGGGGCRDGTETVTGVAFYDAATHRLFSAALNTVRTNSYVFVGTKR